MSEVGSIAGGLLGGPVGSIVGSVVGGIAQNAAGSVAPGAGANMGQVVGAFLSAFQNALGQSGNQPYGQVSLFPQPFSPFGFNAGLFSNPLSVLVPSGNIFNQLAGGLSNIATSAFGGGSVGVGGFPGVGGLHPTDPVVGGGVGGFPGVGISAGVGVGGVGASASQDLSGVGSKMDALMNEAISLSQSDNPSDLIKAQQDMQKLNQLFTTISTMISIRQQMANEAIKAMKAS
jgi:hypothetical protein